jgi:two-component system, chemotaxis family, chemotaxis protein CheY
MPTGTVLLVTSHEGRDMYLQYCRATGLTVIGASRPEQALPLLQGMEPDVAVTDIVFPGSEIDGKAFVRALRQQLPPNRSIVVMSGYAREEDRESARRSGADAYLVQPTLPQELFKTIRNALTLQQRGRRLPWNWRTGQLAALSTDLGRRHPLVVSEAAELSTATRPPRRRRAHVLLVEDDTSTRDMMALLLESAGFTVSPMIDGGDALAYLKEGGRASVVVLDLMMPRVDGWTFRRAQLADPAIADIPVIVMSASAGASASELHAAATFQKPVDVTQVIGAVRQLAG